MKRPPRPCLPTTGRFRSRSQRQARAKAGAEAYERIQSALQALARERSVRLASAGAPAGDVVKVTVDPWFYVYTQRFNARRLYLAEYTAQQLAGTDAGTPSGVESSPGPDALRMLAGAVGIVKGWISPSFGAYMIAGGAREGLYGSGAAPNWSLLPDRERYRRGEQEAVSKVTIELGGREKTFLIVAGKQGDVEPYDVEGLTAATWAALMDVLVGVPSSRQRDRRARSVVVRDGGWCERWRVLG
ncbi:hypothetical protein Bpfe_031092 [Biomphalaria pfeifferi]|uniref:Uncharacterized protein n=1 Tax=Biomphalaria pfeifferi TaxID=112525 RepID=A0AAD8ANJ8_BIOPF|nr:hypothetical protein Bpfe_031092 [Biomphalaria pfeifferi]